MENSNLKGRILKELQNHISRSCTKGPASEAYRQLHELILKKHYKAAEVAIDYHRNRVTMEVLMDDTLYEPGKVNLNLPTLRVSLFYKNLCGFLQSCLETDPRSLTFYAWLLRSHGQKESPPVLV